MLTKLRYTVKVRIGKEAGTTGMPNENQNRWLYHLIHVLTNHRRVTFCGGGRDRPTSAALPRRSSQRRGPRRQSPRSLKC